MSNIQSSCAYCGVGCGVSLTPSSASDIGFKLQGDIHHPANKGQLCAKGERLLESLAQPNTLRYPKLKSGKPVEWSEAITTIADTFKQTIERYGSDSVAFYLSGQLLTEDYYVANKLAKGFIGTSNVDTNSRLCMSSAVSAHMRAFGEDVVPGCYDDFEQAQVIVLVGSNAAWTHPVLFQRMVKARELNGTKIVVIDPAKTATTNQADLHLQIAPGTDTLLFNGLLNFIANNDGLKQSYIDAHTENFADTLAHVASQTADIETLAKSLTLNTSELYEFYQLFITNDKVMTASCQGVNQSVSGTDTTNAMINCHLALGHIGQAGSGFLSLTGQPNAMGGREVGGLATQLACHMGFSEQERQLLGNFWQSDVIAKEKGLTAVELFDAMADGKIKAVWIMGTNPLVSMPNTSKISEALEACPFVVVSDITQDSATAKMADILLPAQGWSEKCGTVTNSERVITRQRGFIAAKGVAKADWWALAEVAKAMGFEQNFSFNNSAAVFKEFAQLSSVVKQSFPQKQFDLTGLAELTETQYDNLLPTQWPIADSSSIGLHSQRAYSDGVFSTLTGKAQFVETTAKCTLSPLSETQVRLNSGRSRDQWHTMTRTGHVASLRASIPEPFISLHPSTLSQLNLAEDDFVTFSENMPSLPEAVSASKRPVARVVADEKQTLDMAFMSMHWSNQFSIGQGVNVALNSQYDPHSKQPAFKCQTVELVKVPVALQGVIFGLHDPKLQGVNWNVQQTLSAGACHHIGFEDAEAGFAFQSTLHSLKWTVQLATLQIIHVQCNVNKSQLVSLKLLSETKVAVSLEAMHLLIGQTVDVALMRQLHQLIKAGNSPLVCACTGVTEANIQDAMLQKLDDTVFNKRGANHNQSRVISAADFDKALDETQAELGCGRQCGSCQSEVTQCGADVWNIGLADITTESPEQERKSTQEEVA